MKNKLFILLTLVVMVVGLAGCGGASKEPLPRSLKGYELYSWQDAGQWHFTLITGTNRNKTLSEIINGDNGATGDGWVNLHAVGVNEIKGILGRVPEGEWVSWSAGKFVTEPAELNIKLELPPQEIINQLTAYAEKCGLKFQVF